ncbi:SGNH/GDSL hydrolase family protein [Pseudonocardia sp. GCM10023141]|uniref:SGNH/GDSL hydrolase family protein n=1 Tax=Pseudonocardia sp. GCM10023141 TaxID=3252653 RepID=UPI003605E73B
MTHRRNRLIAAGVGAALALSLAVPGVASATAGGPVYVALGDSSAAGPLIPLQNDVACLRSDHNWPRVVAAALGATIKDVTCSGAKVADLPGRQFGIVAPQYDAVTTDADLVTIAIGANDLDLGVVVPTCANPLPEPAGISCKARLTAGGTDPLAAKIDALAPRIGAALVEIHRRAPHARVVVVGYGTYWKPGGCWPADPIWGRDADYLQATFDRLMTMLANQAAAHDAGYADIRTPSADHGVCAPVGQRWMEGLVPTAAAAPYHPNGTGMQHAGAVVAAAAGSSSGRD